MKCANCDKGALFVYQITETKEILYCGNHLPKFLDARRRAGNLKTTEQFIAERNTAIQTVAVEVPAVEETPEEEPKKPKSKAKKAAENNESNS